MTVSNTLVIGPGEVIPANLSTFPDIAWVIDIPNDTVYKRDANNTLTEFTGGAGTEETGTVTVESPEYVVISPLTYVKTGNIVQLTGQLTYISGDTDITTALPSGLIGARARNLNIQIVRGGALSGGAITIPASGGTVAVDDGALTLQAGDNLIISTTYNLL